jgi:hypothetical protein
MAANYYRENYRKAKEAQEEAEREGDFVRAEANRKAALRWLDMEFNALKGESEEIESDN